MTADSEQIDKLCYANAHFSTVKGFQGCVLAFPTINHLLAKWIVHQWGQSIIKSLHKEKDTTAVLKTVDFLLVYSWW